MKLTIIITTFNELSLTKKLISDLDLLYYKDSEIIFVDNSSSDGTQEYVERYGKVLLNKLPAGVNNGRNLAVQEAQGEYVRIMNNDIRLSEHIDKKLVEQLDRLREKNIFVSCPMTTCGPNEWEVPAIANDNNIAGWCYMIKKEDCEKCFPIPNELRLWFGDNWIYERLGCKVGFGGGFIHHYVSKTLNSPENKKAMDKIIAKDKLNWILLHE